MNCCFDDIVSTQVDGEKNICSNSEYSNKIRATKYNVVLLIGQFPRQLVIGFPFLKIVNVNSKLYNIRTNVPRLMHYHTHITHHMVQSQLSCVLDS